MAHLAAVDAAALAGPSNQASTPPRPPHNAAGATPSEAQSSLVTLSEYKSQTVKDYSLTIEYKHLQLRAPGGVYVVPSFDNLRVWHGVIFIRQGMYRDGIFKFRIDIPDSYPADDARPTVTFHTSVYHPLVDPETGELDLDCRFPTWRYGHDYLVFVLVFIKKIFYTKEFPLQDFPYPRNPEALKLFNLGDKETYLARVASCVQASLDTCTDDNDPASSLQFSPYMPAHENFFNNLVAPGGRRGTAKENEEPSRA